MIHEILRTRLSPGSTLARPVITAGGPTWASGHRIGFAHADVNEDMLTRNMGFLPSNFLVVQ